MHTRSFRRVALLVVSLAFPAAASGIGFKYQPKGRPVEYKGHFSTFPSGMRLVVYEMPHVDRFLLSVSHRAGSVDDPAGKEGLAHLVEHLTFRAAPAPGAPRLWAQLVGSGMRFNAFTEMDHTDYWISGKPDELGQALRTEALRMKDPLAGVTEDDFAIERDVVLAEWRERFETDLDGAAWQWIRELAFPGHPYARPIAGTPESLKAISLADAQAWTKSHYDTAGVVMVVVSPFSAEHTARRVMDAFGPFIGDPTNPRQPIAHEPPKRPGPPARNDALPLRKAPVHQPELWVAWPVPGTYASLEPQILAVESLLEDRLMYRVAKLARGDVVDNLEVLLDFMDGSGLLAVRVVLHDASKADKVLESVRFAAAELGLGVTTADLDPIRDWLLVRSYLRLENVSAPEIAQYLRATGRPDFLGDWPKGVAVQLSRDVDVFAHEWLGADRSAAMLVVPDRNLRARDLAGGSPSLPAYVDPLEDETAVLEPPPPERVAAALRAPGLARAERRTLENGLRVAFLQRGSLPVADVRVALRTPAEGSAAAPLGAPLLALSSSSASFVGEKTLGIGLSRTQRRSVESLVLGGRGSSGNLVDIVETQARWARKLSFSGPRFDVAKKIVRRVYEAAERDPLQRTWRALLERLFPDHPYGSSVTARSVDALASRQASAWLDGSLRPERATLVVVSDVAPSPEGWRWIEGEFAGWKGGAAGPVPPAPVVPPPPARSAVVVERRGATQALVAVGFRVPPITERDAPAFDALRWLLASRLNQRIRVEEGVSYGVSVGTVDRRQAAALTVGAVVDAEATARTVTTILGAARDLAAAPLPPATAARARWMVARRFAGEFETVADAANGLERMALYGLPDDYYDRMPERIASLDAARIQAAAKTLALGHEVIVVSGDRSVVPALAQASVASEVWGEPAP